MLVVYCIASHYADLETLVNLSLELCPKKATGVKEFSILIKYVGTRKRVMLEM